MGVLEERHRDRCGQGQSARREVSRHDLSEQRDWLVSHGKELGTHSKESGKPLGDCEHSL